jgi:hypothetical protein
MATTLRTIIFVLLFALITQIQFNLDADKTAIRQLKNATEIAVHDSGLAVEQEALSEGKIVFDQNKAMENFKASLENNLDLSSTAGYVYNPTDSSFFQQDLYLVDLEFIDDSNTDSYPFVYSNSNYHILENIEGPSIIAVMTTESPRWFKGNLSMIRQAAVYQYKNN